MRFEEFQTLPEDAKQECFNVFLTLACGSSISEVKAHLLICEECTKLFAQKFAEFMEGSATLIEETDLGKMN